MLLHQVSPGAGLGMMWENMPAALTELFGNTANRARVDLSALLSNVKHAFVSAVPDVADTTLVRPQNDWNAAHTVRAIRARLSVDVLVVGVAGSKIRAQYSLDGSSWSYLDGSAGPSAAADVLGVNVSGWVTITAPALTDVWIRFVGLDGNAVVDPEFGVIQLQVQ